MVKVSTPEPVPFRHLVLAFACAPAASAVVLGLMAGLKAGLFDGAAVAFVGLLVFGYPLTLLVGVPTYLLLRHRTRLTLVKATLAGALVAGLSFSLMLALGPARKIISGTTSLADLQICGIVFGAGALGGLTFGLVALKQKPCR